MPIDFEHSRNVRLVTKNGLDTGSSDLLGDVHGLGFIRPVVGHDGDHGVVRVPTAGASSKVRVFLVVLPTVDLRKRVTSSS